MATKHVGILADGSDVPGLKSVTKTVVHLGNETDCTVESPGPARHIL